MAGVTNEGFDALRLADIIDLSEAELDLITDPVSGDKLQSDFGGDDPAMQIVKVPLDLIASAWEMAALAVDQFNPNAAVGPSLRSLVLLNNLKAHESSSSFVPLQLTGTPAAVIPFGVLATDEGSAVQWRTEDTVTLNGSGLATVNAIATTVGPNTAAPNTVTRLVSPVAGLISVTNLTGTSDAGGGVGRFAEEEGELRRRREKSTSAPGFGPIEAIRANLANIPGVTYAKVYRNTTLVTDGRGIAARSIAPVIVGGADETIARVLMQRTGVSAEFYGTSSLTLYDDMGEPYPIEWTRPAQMVVYVEMDIHIDDSGLFPSDGLQQIRDNIVAYAAGGARALGITDGYDTSGFPPGSLIELTQLYTPVNKVPGMVVVNGTLKIGVGSMGAVDVDDIQTPWNQYPVFIADAAHIDINPV